MKVLVSNCLLGVNCRYNGETRKNEKVLEFLKDKAVIGVCPELAGGLPIPRDPSEIVGNKVISKSGKDVTEEYLKGASIALKLAQENNVDLVIFKAKSPSCGVGLIHDGSFSGNIINKVLTEFFACGKLNFRQGTRISFYICIEPVRVCRMTLFL